MKRIDRELLRHRAHVAREAAINRPPGVHVWWDLERDEFIILRADCVMAQLLADRLDAKALSAYVGRFEAPCSKNDMVEALEAHVEGRLVA